MAYRSHFIHMDRRHFIRSSCAVAVYAALPCAVSAQNSEYDFYFTRLSYESGNWEVDERMPANVLNSLIEYTSLRVDLQERVIPLSDPNMLNAPFCFMAGHRLVQFTCKKDRTFNVMLKMAGLFL